VTPDQEPRTGRAWPVNLHFSESQGAVFHEPVDTCDVFECRRGSWFPIAEATALRELVLHVDRRLLSDHGAKAYDTAQGALAEAIDAQAEALIDPNDPAVREAVREAVWDVTGGDEPYGEIVSAVLAALRSKS
jgi:hypothetical protein